VLLHGHAQDIAGRELLGDQGQARVGRRRRHVAGHQLLVCLQPSLHTAHQHQARTAQESQSVCCVDDLSGTVDRSVELVDVEVAARLSNDAGFEAAKSQLDLG
jgi:hypothetical protein